MPTLLRWKGYRFFFYSADGSEPAHVHVYKDGKQLKVWLGNVSIAVNLRFSATALSEITREVRDERTTVLEAWNGDFVDRSP